MKIVIVLALCLMAVSAPARAAPADAAAYPSKASFEKLVSIMRDMYKRLGALEKRGGSAGSPTAGGANEAEV
ncbi:MAG: hypothetical protein EOP11_10120, partial [Proteobacteria bacterium]